MTTWASSKLRSRFIARGAVVRFEPEVWHEIVRELRSRGQGRRESGAFLLAERGSRRVERAVYFNDLDPDCLNGAIAFDGAYYDGLWQICENSRLVVVADIHTHPRTSVAQSPIDRDNPMIARLGHVALIVPRFAVEDPPVAAIGVHKYLGDDGWVSSFGANAGRLIYVGRFA